ncbi:hypothetical protein ASPWEDRAFT_182832 [Aspergillus wentii DTO 134E9]|uniref:Uncharacterized protein n=1 Tax=Aspergillus wentii DTO 134E9 TaxID=1073089 RepID=A0A1L9RIC2_ASPWE|nr:uncharacterized protein ASPWEDRAFT_182832 [Aspergillus wentii DTO 134E9]KAI9932353.1 hypothetical protein MW887_009866 [Aspergillus wentii]OJJ34680.1 hypothetical protein ASPWEDRAFT_182832 [Aspergillus wentii DTO 134E9]
MSAVHRFRSVWGVAPGDNYSHWQQWFPTLKQQGYVGVEIDITGHTDLATIRRIADEAGLEISVLIHTQWPSYAGPKPPGLTPQDHLNGYRAQLQAAKALRPVKINAHSGDDGWTTDQAVEFFSGTFAIDAEVGLEGRVSHETHRNRALFTPYATAAVVKRVPNIRLTGDFSHFVVACERLLDVGEEDKELIRTIIPNVTHIHARMGTIQSSQIPEPTNPVFAEERKFFENAWKQMVQSIATRYPSDPITFVPEYGPYPYHPFGSATDYSDVADSEGSRLQPIFEAFAKQAA